MKHVWVAWLLIYVCATFVAAATEQETAKSLAQRLQQAMGERRNMVAVQELRMQAALTVAADKRELDLAIARQQLAAELASAAAGMVGADPAIQPPQLRGQYIQAVNIALGQFTNVVNTSQQEWNQQINAAFQRLQQDENNALQTLQQSLSTGSQAFGTSINSIPTDIPPDVNASLPDLTGTVTTDDIIAAAEKAVTEARSGYREDITKVLSATYAELPQIVANTVPAERADGIRTAINKLRLLCVDRFDQYDNEVRSILRKALLAMLQ